MNDVLLESNQPKKPEPKNRKCLMCQALFMSSWAGERVCKKCKSTTKWKSGGF